jgi:hypothetical protein
VFESNEISEVISRIFVKQQKITMRKGPNTGEIWEPVSATDPIFASVRGQIHLFCRILFKASAKEVAQIVVILLTNPR